MNIFQINNKVLVLISTEAYKLYKPPDDECEELSIELQKQFLNSFLDVSGFPPQELNLKPGCVCYATVELNSLNVLEWHVDFCSSTFSFSRIIYGAQASHLYYFL